jgi:hypothetical protein
MTQADKIMNYMERYGSITQIDALREFGCMRLASRISDLRRDGIRIKSEMVKAKNRFGEPISFARYSLEDAE